MRAALDGDFLVGEVGFDYFGEDLVVEGKALVGILWVVAVVNDVVHDLLVGVEGLHEVVGGGLDFLNAEAVAGGEVVGGFGVLVGEGEELVGDAEVFGGAVEVAGVAEGVELSGEGGVVVEPLFEEALLFGFEL